MSYYYFKIFSINGKACQNLKGDITPSLVIMRKKWGQFFLNFLFYAMVLKCYVPRDEGRNCNDHIHSRTCFVVFQSWAVLWVNVPTQSYHLWWWCNVSKSWFLSVLICMLSLPNSVLQWDCLFEEAVYLFVIRMVFSRILCLPIFCCLINGIVEYIYDKLDPVFYFHQYSHLDSINP